MNLAVIVPDRGDRPALFKHCKKLIKAQTYTPKETIFVNFEPESDEPDITQRYRIGYSYASKLNIDLIAFMESDDWYSPYYLETMIREYEKAGHPDLFGTRYTIYYNIRIGGSFTMHHESRSSAMSTLIRPNLQFEWCNDNEVFTDSYLYSKLDYKLFSPEKTICLGIKHGIGLCGGRSHVDRLHRYTLDHNKQYLKSIVDVESFDLYESLFPSTRST